MTFDEKYEIVMKQIDNIFRNDKEHDSLKKYIEGYKIDKMMLEREEKKSEESFHLYGSVDRSALRQRKQIVGLAEIKEHEKTYAKAKYEKIAQKEINRMKERERQNEYNSKIEKEMKMNRKRLENFEQKKDEKKEIKNNLAYSNNIKKKEFSDFVNKINIEKIQSNKKPLSKYSPALTKQIPKQKQQIEQSKLNEVIRNKVSYSQQNQKKRVFQLKKNVEISNSKENRKICTSPNTKAKSIEKPQIQKDFLKEGLKYAKRNKENKLNNLFESKRYNNQEEFVDNIEKLKFQAKKYEDLAKKQEQLIKLNGGPKNNLKASEKASAYLFDSIIAKISLLKQISSES